MNNTPKKTPMNRRPPLRAIRLFLDSHSSDELLQLFEDINKQGQTVLMVTHSTKAASSAKRVLFIKDGRVFHQLYRGSSTKQEMYQKISDTLTMIATGGVRSE